MIKNKKFSNAINNIPQSTPPIWFMRQAGRYHSHYQSLRKKYSFVELCKTPNLAAEVAMGPINDFDYDVAILFSDILFPLPSSKYPIINEGSTSCSKLLFNTFNIFIFSSSVTSSAIIMC